jgi:hypothetical protein
MRKRKNEIEKDRERESEYEREKEVNKATTELIRNNKIDKKKKKIQAIFAFTNA